MPLPFDVQATNDETRNNAPSGPVDPELIAELTTLGRVNKQAFDAGTISEDEYLNRQNRIANPTGPEGDGEGKFGLLDAIGYTLSLPVATVTNAGRLGLGAVAPGDAGIGVNEFFTDTFDPKQQQTPFTLAMNSDLPTWAKFGAGIVGEIALDPLTYIGVGIVDDIFDGARFGLEGVDAAGKAKLARRLDRGKVVDLLSEARKAGKLPSSVSEADALKVITSGGNWRTLTNRQLSDLGVGLKFNIAGKSVNTRLPAKLTGEVGSKLTNPIRTRGSMWLARKAAGAGDSGTVWSALFTPGRQQYAKGIVAAAEAAGRSQEEAWGLIDDAILTNTMESLVRKTEHTVQVQLQGVLQNAETSIKPRIDEIPQQFKEIVVGTRSASKDEDAVFAEIAKLASAPLDRFDWFSGATVRGGVARGALDPNVNAGLSDWLSRPQLVELSDAAAKTFGAKSIDITPWTYILAQNSEIMGRVTGGSMSEFLSAKGVITGSDVGLKRASDAFDTSRLSRIIAQEKEFVDNADILNGLVATRAQTMQGAKFLADIKIAGSKPGTVFVGFEGADADAMMIITLEGTKNERRFNLGELSAAVAARNAGRDLADDAAELLDAAIGRGLVRVGRDTGAEVASEISNAAAGLVRLDAEVENAAKTALAGSFVGVSLEDMSLNRGLKMAFAGASTQDEIFDIAEGLGLPPAALTEIIGQSFEGSEELAALTNTLFARLADANDEIFERLQYEGVDALASPSAINEAATAVSKGTMSPADAARQLGRKSIEEGRIGDDIASKMLAGIPQDALGQMRGLPTADRQELANLYRDQLNFLGVSSEPGKVVRRTQAGFRTIPGEKFSGNLLNDPVEYKKQEEVILELLTRLTGEAASSSPDAYRRWESGVKLVEASVNRAQYMADEMEGLLGSIERRGRSPKFGRTDELFVRDLVMNPTNNSEAVIGMLTDNGWSPRKIKVGINRVRAEIVQMQDRAAKARRILDGVDLSARSELSSEVQQNFASAAEFVTGRLEAAGGQEWAKMRELLAREDLVGSLEDVTYSTTSKNPLTQMQSTVYSLQAQLASLGPDEFRNSVVANAVASRVREMEKLAKDLTNNMTKVLDDPKLRTEFLRTINAPWNSDGALRIMRGFIVEDGSRAERMLRNSLVVREPKDLGWVARNLLKPLNDLFRSGAIATPGFNVRNMFGGLVNNISFMERPVDSYRAMFANIDVGLTAHVVENMNSNQWRIFAEKQGIKDGQEAFIKEMWGKISDSDTREVMQRALRETDWVEVGRIGEATDELLRGDSVEAIRQRMANIGRSYDAATALASVGIGRRILGRGGEINPASIRQARKLAKSATGGGLTGFRHGSPSVEILNRMALAIDQFSYQLGRGQSAEGAWRKAVDMVDMVHFDYSDLTTTQSNLRAAYVPFIAWRANNTPLQWQRLMYGRWGPKFQIRQQASNREDSQSFQNPWDRNNTPISESLSFSNRFDPFNDLLEIADNVPGVGDGGNPRAILTSDISPIAKLLYEIPSGQRADTGYSLKGGSDGYLAPRWQNVRVLGPTMGGIFKALGMGYEQDGILYVNSRADHAMNQMLPMLRYQKLISKDSDPETPATDESLVVNWMNFFGIDVRYLSPERREKNVRGERFELSDRMKATLRRQGMLEYG